jgi:hypothetical protein
MKMPNLLNRKQRLKTESEVVSYFSCKECGMEFTEMQRLKKHRKIAHSGRGERKKPSPY